MIADIQKLFLQLAKMKKERKKLREQIENCCLEIPEYADLREQAKGISQKIKLIRKDVLTNEHVVATKIDDLNIDIESTQTTLADAILVGMTKGEDIKIEDENSQMILPIFSVKFKKDN